MAMRAIGSCGRTSDEKRSSTSASQNSSSSRAERASSPRCRTMARRKIAFQDGQQLRADAGALAGDVGVGQIFAPGLAERAKVLAKLARGGTRAAAGRSHLGSGRSPRGPWCRCRGTNARARFRPDRRRYGQRPPAWRGPRRQRFQRTRSEGAAPHLPDSDVASWPQRRHRRVRRCIPLGGSRARDFDELRVGGRFRRRAGNGRSEGSEA